MADLRQRVAGLSPKKHELLLRLLKSKGSDLPRLRPISRETNAPLSYAQEGVWFLDQLQPGIPFNVPISIRFQGPLNIEVLETALNAVIRRHEVLRTTFAELDGQPVQVIAPSLHVSITTVPIAGKDDKERLAELLKRVVLTARDPFDLSKGPLLRMTVYRLDADDHVVVFTVHHSVFDGWSIDIFAQELGGFYTSLVSGSDLSLPDLPVQYADYAVWQREVQQGGFLQPQLDYWTKQLAQLPAGLSLPVDHSESTARLFQGDAVSFTLPRALSDDLRTLGRTERSTLFMVLLAAFKLLLARYTGEDDLVVGTPVANRSQPEQQKLIGFCVNLLALRTDLSGNLSFRQVLQRVREVCLTGYRHQDLPFGMLVQKLHPDRYSTHTPIFQVQFALQDLSKSMANIPGLRLSSIYESLSEELKSWIAGVTPAVDHLFLQMMDSGEELSGFIHYRADLFDRETIERMLKHFVRLLEAVVATPDSSQIALLTEQERRDIVYGWNQTQQDIGAGECIHERFAARAGLTPEAVAVTLSQGMRTDGKEYELSYGELDRRANQLCRYLQNHGVKTEARIGLCVGRSLELAVGVLGILKSGAAYVPLDVTQPRERLKRMIENSGITVVVTREAERETLGDLVAGLVLVDVDHARDESEEKPDSAVNGQNAAYVIYTSGSTGEPKGVVVTHASVVNHNVAVSRLFGLDRLDRVLQFHTVSFDAAVEELFPTWNVGATVVMRGEELVAPGEEFEKLIEHEQLTVVNLPTAYWQEWVIEGERRKTLGVHGLRLVVVGGDKATAERYQAWQALTDGHVRWVNTYGPTEATVITSLYEPEPEARGEVSGGMSIGRPIGNARMYVLDDRLEPTPVGVRGELWIGGQGLARGYLGRPDLTAERFVPDPFAEKHGLRMYRTGDRARYRPDGHLEFLGRVDHQVKIRGFRIELAEIEIVLRTCPAVQDAVVIAVDEADNEKHLNAFVIAVEGEELTATDLREFLSRQLPHYMVPAGFTFLDRFPVTSGGKIDRHALSMQTSLSPASAAVYVEPHTATEIAVAQIWSDLLGVERVGINDNFFDLGGHSLLATQAVSRVRAKLEVDLSLRDFFHHPTVGDLAQAVDLALVAGRVAPMDGLDLEQEAELDPDIVVTENTLPPSPQPSRVFLTGATGFLGAFLLRELLDRTTADVHCLVRATSLDDGFSRLRQTLEKYDLWVESSSTRIVPVLGDLSEKRLGLSDEQYEELARNIDVIYHNGAWVNMMYSYTMLKPANVLGTQEVLRLACDTKVKPVHYVSTISVFPHDKWISGLLEETWVVEDGNSMRGGYPQSKWVAEKLVSIAAARGLPVAIYRPGRISGDSRTGIWTPESQLLDSIQTILEVGSVPRMSTLIPLELVPVEYVAQSIVHLSQQAASIGKTFHLVNPEQMPWKEFVARLNTLGYPMQEIDPERWHEELVQYARRTPTSFLNLLLPVLPPDIFTSMASPATGSEAARSGLGRVGILGGARVSMLHIDCTNVFEGLKDSEITCRPVRELIDLYLAYFLRNGMLTPPAAEILTTRTS
jgi:amino acid adenylation domain-containing protein/thioester reductase-like protein